MNVIYLLFSIIFSKLAINANRSLIFHMCNPSSMNIMRIVNHELRIFTYSLSDCASSAKNMNTEIFMKNSHSRPIEFLTLNGFFWVDCDEVIPRFDKFSWMDSRIFIFLRYLNVSVQNKWLNVNDNICSESSTNLGTRENTVKFHSLRFDGINSILKPIIRTTEQHDSLNDLILNNAMGWSYLCQHMKSFI